MRQSDDERPVVYDLPIIRQARRTGELPKTGLPQAAPYKTPLERQRERYWSGPVVRNKRRSLLDWLLNRG
jgi:hypothetical protein